MLTKLLHDTGPRSWHMRVASLASIVLCITLWIRAKTVDQASAATPSAAPCSSDSGRPCSG